MHPPPPSPRRETLLVATASAFGWILLAGFVGGGLYGLSLDVQAAQAADAERDPNWGPQLPGELLPAIRFGHQALVECANSTWTRYLSPDFDHLPDFLGNPLTVPVNKTGAPDLDWTFISQQASTLFGVTLQAGDTGLPVVLLERSGEVTEKTGGRLNHDQHYISDSKGHMVYRDHSLYQIELFPTGDGERFFLHEFGHSLGLGHIDRDGQIMAHRSDRMAFRIHECHADWIQHLAPTVWRHTWP